jgi:hypothetical protein
MYTCMYIYRITFCSMGALCKFCFHLSKETRGFWIRMTLIFIVVGLAVLLSILKDSGLIFDLSVGYPAVLCGIPQYLQHML